MFLASDGDNIPFLPSFNSFLVKTSPVLGSTILVDVVIFAFGLDILLAGMLNITLPTFPILVSVTCLKSPSGLITLTISDSLFVKANTFILASEAVVSSVSVSSKGVVSISSASKRFIVSSKSDLLKSCTISGLFLKASLILNFILSFINPYKVPLPLNLAISPLENSSTAVCCSSSSLPTSLRYLFIGRLII